MGGGRTGSLRVALALALGACATVPEGPVIDSFVIEGTRQIKERDLKKKVLTSDSFLPWLPFFGREEHFDPNAWASDQRRVERYYQAHGFYQARVVGEEVTPDETGDHVHLKLEVREGDPTVINRFEVGGLDGLAPKQKEGVLEKLPSKTGDVFREEEWEETQALLKRRLLSLGYAGAAPQARAEVDVDAHTANLEISANPGKRYKFGKLYVTDVDGKVNERLIRDQVESVIEEDDWFSPEKLEEAQARVFRMGVFSAVKVTRSGLDQAAGVAPVTVDVREAPFTTWRIGGGLAGDPLRNEIRTSLLYENRNFFGGTRRFTARLLLGYTALAGSASTGFFALVSVVRNEPGAQHGPFGTLTLEVEQPHFLTRLLSIALTVEPEYLLEPAYRAAGGRVKGAFIARPTSRITASASYNISIHQLSAPVGLASSSTQFVGCGLTCVVHYFEETFAWDRRDEVLEPHDGWYTAASFQQGGNTLPSGGFQAFNFFRFLPEARGYVSFFDKKVVLAGRARVGFMAVLNGTAPIPVRFFSGGNDMRGFSARRLAPYEVVARDDCRTLGIDPLVSTAGACAGNGEVLAVGGNTLIDASLELRWNAWGPLTIATFVDVGYVTAGGFSVALLRSMNVAVGLGVRYRTPIGPIRLDLAARLPWVGAPLEAQGRVLPHAVARGCFLGLGAGPTDSYPGSPEGQCSFHLSIGEAF